MNVVIGILGAGIGSGLMAIILACLQHKWKKEDQSDVRIDALVASQKIMMVHTVKSLARPYIEHGEICIEEKETLQEMYAAYKALGGNGHLDPTMEAINRLKVVC